VRIIFSSIFPDAASERRGLLTERFTFGERAAGEP
jgi:hypothetical protein